MLESLPDDQIDMTDASGILDWSDAWRGVFHRPVKQQITLRINADIIAWFKARTRNGRGYQSDINGALREHVKSDTHSNKGLIYHFSQAVGVVGAAPAGSTVDPAL